MLKKRKLFVAVFALGAISGVIFGLGKLKASSPAGEASQGVASMYFDEIWRAEESIVSTTTGFNTVDMLNAGGGFVASIGETSAVYDTATGAITASPKMLVTKWKVHGHIHQQ